MQNTYYDGISRTESKTVNSMLLNLRQYLPSVWNVEENRISFELEVSLLADVAEGWAYPHGRR
jgi:hypothetical protein